MREKRCSFSVVVLDGNIYAIGGHCDPTYLDNVERYCPTANSWRYVGGRDEVLLHSELQYVLIHYFFLMYFN